MHKNVFMLPMSFTGCYTEDEPNFPQQSNLILQKKVSGLDKVVNFNDFSRPYKIRNQVLFKDLNQIQGLFKTTKTTFQDCTNRVPNLSINHVAINKELEKLHISPQLY